LYGVLKTDKKKGLDIILQVWDKLLASSKSNIELLIIGTEKKISNTNISVIGKIPNAQLNKYLQVSDFYLFSTLWQEGFGLSLLEAMKSGAYCIASNMGAVSEVLNDGEYGKLINTPHNVDAWVKEILVSIDEYILDNFENRYSKVIPNDYCDIKKWNNGLNSIIQEAKVNFSNRYYI
jgi:glycosyltransferase involved in cell wall biosynthesis